MENKSQVSSKYYYLMFTLIFFVIAGIIFFPFAYYGKTMIEYHDALHQYYSSFEYFSDYLQDVLKNLFSTGRIELPMWDFTIGMGGDVLTSLNYYVIGDPLNLVGVLFKHNQLEIVFQLLIIFRIYLAGVSFSIFCRKLGYIRWETLLGAFIYCFSMFALYSACMYAAFPNVLIYLPLLLLGVEKVFRGEKGYTLLFVTALCLISNFYFSYMLALLTVTYCVIRYFVINYYIIKKGKKIGILMVIKDFIRQIVYMLLPVLTGALLSCVVLLPVLYVFLHQGRGAGQVVDNLYIYSGRDYVELLGSFFSPKISKDYNLMGYCPIVFLGFMLLFQKLYHKKRTKQVLRVLFVVAAIFLAIPFFGYALNGFAYLNSRWIFGLSFLSAFVVVVFFEDLLHLNVKNKKIMVIGAMIYLIFYLVVRSMHTMAITTGILWLFVILGVVLFLGTAKIQYKKKRVLLMGVCLICVAYYGYFFYSPFNTTIMQTKLDTNATQKFAQTQSAGATQKIKDKSFYRIDVVDEGTLNEGLLLKYNSVAFYYSLYDGRITEFNKELDNSGLSVPNLSHGNGGRVYLNLLTNVKYVITDRKEDIPYGYEYYDSYEMEDGSKKVIAENKLKLPFGYTVGSYYLRENYEKLSSLQKEQTMLQGAVIEQAREDMTELLPTFTDNSIPYSIKKMNGLTINEDTISVTEENATVTLEVNVPENTELFVQGTGIQYHAYTPNEFPEYFGGETEGKELTRYSQLLWKENYKNWIEPTSVIIKAKMNGIEHGRSLYQKSHKYYWEQDSFLLSLGCQKSGKQSLTLTFSNIGEYRFSDINILAENLAVLPGQVDSLKSEQLENVNFSSNEIEGEVTTEGKRLLLLSVPYSIGWTATVDGKEQEVICANTMWTAIPIDEAGSHEIKLYYHTPGLKIGFIISIITFLLILAYYVMSRYKGRKRSI